MPPRPSLMELSITMSPWTHIKSIRLLKSEIESKLVDVVATSALENSFDASTVWNQEAGALSVNASLAVSAGDFVRITAEFVVDYTVDKTIPFNNEAASAFGRMNGIHNVWPYWREYVQSISVRLGLPPITLPLMTGAAMLAYYAEKDKPSDDPQAAQQPEESGPRLGGAAGL